MPSGALPPRLRSIPAIGTSSETSITVPAKLYLRSLGRNVDSFESLEAERRRRFAQNIESVLPVTCVVSENDKSLPLSVFSGNHVSIDYRIDLEDGSRLSSTVNTSQLPETRTTVLDDRRWSTYRFQLSAEVPLGYRALGRRGGLQN